MDIEDATESELVQELLKRRISSLKFNVSIGWAQKDLDAESCFDRNRNTRMEDLLTHTITLSSDNDNGLIGFQYAITTREDRDSFNKIFNSQPKIKKYRS